MAKTVGTAEGLTPLVLPARLHLHRPGAYGLCSLTVARAQHSLVACDALYKYIHIVREEGRVFLLSSLQQTFLCVYLCLPGTTNSRKPRYEFGQQHRLYRSRPTYLITATTTPPIRSDPKSKQPIMPSITTSKKMWRKRFLVPLWTVELIVTGIFFILACVVLSYANDPNVEDAGYSRVFS
jgi:hypothetical protein